MQWLGRILADIDLKFGTRFSVESEVPMDIVPDGQPKMDHPSTMFPEMQQRKVRKQNDDVQ